MEPEFHRKESVSDLKSSSRIQKKESMIGLQSNVSKRGQDISVAQSPLVAMPADERREYEKHARKELEHLKLVLTAHEKLHALLKLGVASANTISQLLVLMEDDANHASVKDAETDALFQEYDACYRKLKGLEKASSLAAVKIPQYCKNIDINPPSRPLQVLPAPVVGNNIRLTISIPSIQSEYKTTFDKNMTIKQIKAKLLQKMTSCSIQHADDASYYVSVNGVRVLDDSNLISQVANQDSNLELVRIFHYQIAGGNSQKPILILQNDLTKTAIDKFLPFLDILNQKKSKFTLQGIRNGLGSDFSPDSTFASYGLRSTDQLFLLADCNGSTTKVELKIEYSPFDSIDKQKKEFEMNGYLTKQGGSKGGARNWQKRYFEMTNDKLIYSETEKSSKILGFINLVQFLDVKDVTKNYEEKDDANYYFTVTTPDRTLVVRTTDQQEVKKWMTAIRDYSELIAVEQLHYSSPGKQPDAAMAGLTSNQKRKKTNVINALRFRNTKDEEEPEVVVSQPFFVNKSLSVSTDFKWNSSDNPCDVFSFIEEIGVGAAGRVVKAKHKHFENFILAVKIVPLVAKEMQDELEKEMEILKTCRSDNVIAYYGCIIRDSDTWILMDYCGAGAVKDVMNATGDTLNEKQIQYVVRSTLKGLSYLHFKGILHLDIKAANILLTEEGIVKLADFGVSQVLLHSDETVKINDYVGSPLYMSPEVIMKAGYNDRTDVWSLGITMIEMAQGRPPNNDIRRIEDLPKLVERPPAVFAKPEHYSAACNAFLAKCLVKDPAHRLSAKEMLCDEFTFAEGDPKCLHGLIWESIELKKGKRKAITDMMAYIGH